MVHDVELPRSVICVLVTSGDTPGFAPSRAWRVSVEGGVGRVGSKSGVCLCNQWGLQGADCNSVEARALISRVESAGRACRLKRSGSGLIV